LAEAREKAQWLVPVSYNNTFIFDFFFEI